MGYCGIVEVRRLEGASGVDAGVRLRTSAPIAGLRDGAVLSTYGALPIVRRDLLPQSSELPREGASKDSRTRSTINEGGGSQRAPSRSLSGPIVSPNVP